MHGQPLEIVHPKGFGGMKGYAGATAKTGNGVDGRKLAITLLAKQPESCVANGGKATDIDTDDLIFQLPSRSG